MGADEYQEPDINVDPGLVFGEGANRPQGKLTLATSPARLGHSFRLNGPDGEVVARTTPDAAPWFLPLLDYGQYVVTDEDTGQVRHFEIVRPVVDVTF